MMHAVINLLNLNEKVEVTERQLERMLANRVVFEKVGIGYVTEDMKVVKQALTKE